MEPLEVREGGAVIRGQFEGRPVVVLRFLPLPLDVKEGPQVPINFHVLYKRSKDFE